MDWEEERRQEKIKKATTRWHVAAVILVVYIFLLGAVKNITTTWQQSAVYNADPFAMYFAHLMDGGRERHEIEGVDVAKLLDPDEIERNVEEGLKKLKESVQSEIKEKQAVMEQMKAEGRSEP